MVHGDGPLMPQFLMAPHVGLFAQPAEVSVLSLVKIKKLTPKSGTIISEFES